MLIHTLGIFSWRDGAEIISISILCLSAIKILAQSKQYPLLRWLYTYVGLCFAAHFLELSNFSFLLFHYGPASLMLCIVFHQHLLQKNFVTAKNIIPARSSTSLTWLETLVRSALYASNHTKKLYCIIENGDNLSNYVKPQVRIETTLNQNHLALLCTSSLFNDAQWLYCTREGILVGINAVIENVHSLNPEQSAQELTQKTDALCLLIEPRENTFTLFCRSESLRGIKAQHILNFLRKYMQQSSSTTKERYASGQPTQSY